MSSKAYPRDLLIYLAFCALPIAAFWLLNEPGVQFDTALLTISFMVVLGFKHYYKDTSQLVDYDENLTMESIMWIIAGTLGCLAVASYLTTAFVHSLTPISSVFVPQVKLGLTVGQTSLSPFWSNVLYTLTLVATAEETVKLVTSLGLFMYLRDIIGKAWSKIVAVAVPIAVWALLHTYQNPAYQTQYWFVFVGSAFIAGLIMFYVMMKTKSLLAAILTHSFYNITMLAIASGYSLNLLPYPSTSLPLVTFIVAVPVNIVVVCLLLRFRSPVARWAKLRLKRILLG